MSLLEQLVNLPEEKRYMAYRYYTIMETRNRKIPVGAHFELTPLCTLDCKMCYVHLSESEMYNRGRMLTCDEWIELARQAQQLGLLDVTLSGGEPLLRRDFFEIYSRLYNMGLTVGLITNATLIDEKTIELFKVMPPDSISVTLYGFSEETYEKVCRNGRAFSKALQGIRMIKEAGLNLGLQTTTIADNLCDIPQIRRFAEEINVPYRYLSCIGAFRECTLEKAKELDVSIQQMKEVESSIHEAEMPDQINEYGFSCGAGNNSFSIDWQGFMVPCTVVDFIKAEPLKIGVEEAWKKIVEESQKVPQLIECQCCKYRKHCNLCIVNHYEDTHEFGKPSPRLCWKAQHPELIE